MDDLIVDRRFVVEDEIELRLAIDKANRTFNVVGTRNGKLAILDELDEGKLRTIGAPGGIIAPLAKPDLDPLAFLAELNDKQYQRLVCQDPNDLGPVQVSAPVEGFEVVDGEDL